MSRFQPATPRVGSARILAEEHGAEIRDDFLTTDNQNDATCAGHDRTELASTGRRDQKRGLLRHNVVAADNPVGRAQQAETFHGPAFRDPSDRNAGELVDRNRDRSMSSATPIASSVR